MADGSARLAAAGPGRAPAPRGRGEAIDLAALHAEATAIWLRVRVHLSPLALARNPLLLAILVVCQEMHVELPHDRVQFYEHALRTLLGTWCDGPACMGTSRTGESRQTTAVTSETAGR